MAKTKPDKPVPPAHLRPRSAEFWKALNDRFVFEAHDLERLRVCCESMDVIDEAEDTIRRDGRFVPDRYGGVKQHPGINVARDARAAVLRAIREMCVDIESPEEARMPRQGRRYS